MSQPAAIDEWAREVIVEIEQLTNSSSNHNHTNSFNLLKQIITAADYRISDQPQEDKAEVGNCIYADYADDNERFHAAEVTDQFASKTVRWTIRVKAFQLVHRLAPHLGTKHLPDLVRLSFISATSPYDDLKLEGFGMFEYIINRFAFVEEKEFPGHSIIEQYKTQVISAVNPALDSEAPPYITAVASRVLCCWICRDLEKDSKGLKRAYELLLKTIYKIENQNTNQNSKLYTESELEQERLDILGSWAQVYVKSQESAELRHLVEPQVNSLIDKWWEALKDYALLIIPKLTQIETNSVGSNIKSNNNNNNEPVYTRIVALSFFANIWYKLVLAVSHWLCYNIKSDKKFGMDRETIEKYFKFICGIIMKELCSYHDKDQQLPESTKACITSLMILMNDNQIKPIILKDLILVEEFYITIYKIIIRSQRICITFHKCLEHIFKLFIENKSSDQTDCVKTILKKIIRFIESNLDQLRTSITKGEDANQYDTLIIKSNLNIRISNIINILKCLNMKVNDIEIESDVCQIFRSILSFNEDVTIRNYLLNSLSSIKPDEYKDQFEFLRNSLYITKITVLKGHIHEFDNVSKSYLSDINQLVKSIRCDIRYSNDETSSDILAKLIEIIINNSTARAMDERKSSDSRFDQVQLLKAEFSELFEKVLESDDTLRESYADLEKFNRERIMSHGSSSRSDQMSNDSSKNKQISSTKTSKPKTKIVLKTDFGNFYANKH